MAVQNLSCKHPLIGLPCFDEQKRLVYKVIKKYSEISAPLLEKGGFLNTETGEFFDPVLIRCGKCIACRLNYSREWAIRMCLERRFNPDNCWFLTLTYSDDFLPKTDKGLPTLCMDHVSQFVKRLRARLTFLYGESNFRFYAASEYGGLTARPHYHLIAFNLPLSDLKFWENSSDGCLFTSQFLSDVWGFGRVVVAETSFSTCAYTSRYVAKKLNKVDADLIGIEREQSRMSRRPGIGAEFYSDSYDGSKQIFVAPGRSFSHLSSFDRKLRETDPVKYSELVSSRRKIVELFSALNPISKPAWDQLADQERELNRSFKKGKI